MANAGTVCCRWRCIVFASPRRLNLKLYCTQRRLFNSNTLDIWPALPIIIYARDIRFTDDVTNVIAALRHRDRLCKIYYDLIQDCVLEEFAAIDEPFPALTSLRLTTFREHVPVLPDSFLGGSAPQLRSLYLEGIPFHQLENYFHLPPTLSDSPFGMFLIPDIFHPRRSSLVCPCRPGSNDLLLNSDTLDLESIEQADIRLLSPV